MLATLWPSVENILGTRVHDRVVERDLELTA